MTIPADIRRVFVAVAMPLAIACGSNAQRPAWFHAPLLLEALPGDLELVGDVDLDGDLDGIAFFSPSRNLVRSKFTVMLNDGSGNLTPGTTVNLPSDAGSRTHFADVDGDGRGDVLVATFRTSSLGAGILVYPGMAKGQFGSPVHISLPGNVSHLGTGRFNNDKVADIFVMHYATSGAEARWYPGSTTRKFVVGLKAAVPSLQSVGSLAILDTNADGVDDYAVYQGQSSSTGTVSLFRTTSNGFGTGPVIQVPSGWDDSLVVSDIDKDGDPDLVASFSNSNQIGMLPVVNGGSGSWKAGTSQVFQNNGSGHLYAGDWDGDGLEDLVQRELGSTVSTLSYHLSNYYKNLGQGKYRREYWVTHWGVETTNFGVGLFDLDGDGSLDLVDSRSLFFGDGTFDNPFAGPKMDDPVDWDRDGDLDAFSDSLWLNDGGAKFTAVPKGWPSPQSGMAYGSAVAVGDVDGDGLHEALVPLFRLIFPRGSEFVEMRRFQEQASGGFVDAAAAAGQGAQMSAGLLADVDSDKDLDFLDVQGVWVNNGKGFFTKTGASFQGYRPIQVGDVNGDNAEDVLAAYTGNGTGLAILYRTGSAKFSLTVLFQSTKSGIDITSGRLADLDDDGDLDVVGREVPASGSPRTLIFENKAGQLASPQTIQPVGYYAAGDVDGDGRTDLLVGESRIVRVLRRKSTGISYESPVAFAISGARHLVDLDQDGDPDVAGSVLARNRRFEGSRAGARRQYGTAVPGTGGRRPIASIVGPLRAKENPVLRLRNGVGGSFAYMMIGAAESNVPSQVIPGLTLYASPVAIYLSLGLLGTAGVPGAGASDLRVKIPLGLSGARAFFQYVVSDTGGANGISSHTGGVEVQVGK